MHFTGSSTLITAMVILTLSGTACSTVKKNSIAIIPQPVSLIQEKGAIRLNKTFVIAVSDSQQLTSHANYLKERIMTASGLDLNIISGTSKKAINLQLDPSLSDSLGQEGYKLNVTTSSISIRGAAPAGVFYGIQTLFQIMPPAIYGNSWKGGVAWSVPCVNIIDYPRFQWRGYMLDVARHFFPASHIYKVIDQMAMHKLNTLQLHLSDDQGWRIEILRYPKLTGVGAWRVNQEDKHWNNREAQKPGQVADYGGFYTQEEIRNIVQYAAERHITIVPEIEMPAHSTAALAAYPEYSCTGKPLYVLPGGIWPCNNLFCAGKEETFAFLEGVLSEVMDLFPSEYIHIGGDEADKTQWTTCPYCQDRIKKEGLKDENELQSYLIRRVEKILNDHGRNLIGWDEILEGGLAPNAAVMSWRGMQGGIEAAKSGHQVVMTPTSHCYIDYYQGPPQLEPLAIGGYLPLDKVYSMEPVPEGLTPAEAGTILGAQANLWTEYVSTPDHADYMTYPRLSALSEVCWTPAGKKSYEDFTSRLVTQIKRFNILGIHYSNSFASVSIIPQFHPELKTTKVTLKTDFPQAAIHYTTDGSDPDIRSPRYRDTLTIEKTTAIRAAAFLKDTIFSKVSKKAVWMHLALGKTVTYSARYSDRYSGGGNMALTNGIRGTINYSDQTWQGFSGTDLVAEIDLGSVQKIKRVTVGALQDIGSWIFFPVKAKVSYAGDDKTFSELGTVMNRVPANNPERSVQNLALDFDPVNARYVRLEVANLGTCPAGHSGAGNKCWMFIDEIIVE